MPSLKPRDQIPSSLDSINSFFPGLRVVFGPSGDDPTRSTDLNASSLPETHPGAHPEMTVSSSLGLQLLKLTLALPPIGLRSSSSCHQANGLVPGRRGDPPQPPHSVNKVIKRTTRWRSGGPSGRREGAGKRTRVTASHRGVSVSDLGSSAPFRGHFWGSFHMPGTPTLAVLTALQICCE